MSGGNSPEILGDRILVVVDDSMLNDYVGFSELVEIGCVVAEHRARIDASVDSKKRCTYTRSIAARKCPETAVGVSILGADSRMDNVGPETRNFEYLASQDRLAGGKRKINVESLEKSSSLGRIRAVRLVDRNVSI